MDKLGLGRFSEDEITLTLEERVAFEAFYQGGF
jgi:hypothetical protein